ncbi:AraC family transcriptional regulator [Sinomicrobium sp. M5D2P17]
MKTDIQTFAFKALPIDIEVKDLKFIKELPEMLGQPHRVAFYQILWLDRGYAKMNIDFHEIGVESNELLMITPGQICAFDTESAYEGKLILFTGSFFNGSEIDANFLYSSELLNPIRLHKKIAIRPDQMRPLVYLLEKELMQGETSFQIAIAQSYLRIILFESERQFSKDATVLVNSIARRFYNAVENHYKKNRTTEFYQNLLSVNEKKLAKEIKVFSGKTPKVYIDSRIILEAKRLLIYSDLSIQEIGYSLGFEEPSYFNKYFKRHVYSTPFEFRKKHY